MNDGSVVRVGAVADLHCTRTSQGVHQPLFEQAGRLADVLLLGGDLTDFGLPEEAHVLARDLKTAVKVPVVAVLGNHDFEAGKQNEVTDILREAGVTVLDGDACEVRGVGIGGATGFLGGFGRGTHKLALLHYAPIRATVEGEPPEIFPFLGCGRLEEPLNRFGVTAVFHGHAHRGTAAGPTLAGIPVYNVSLPLLRHEYPDRPPLRILELPAVTPPDATEPAGPPKTITSHLGDTRGEPAAAATPGAARKKP
jgi:Icc-related predicted phosphoesterase